MKTLYVVFLWHMHQPLYKDYLTSHYYLPWVRLHATKGYWDMMRAIESNPKAKAVVNLTPSLLYQLKDLSERHIKDKHRELSLRPAEKLTKQDKEYILSNFFMINWENHVLKSKRYTELLDKRGRHTSKDMASKIVDSFKAQDYRDLQVLYNLAWCGFALSEEDSLIKNLKKKGANFTERDKRALILKQESIIAKVIPSYKRLQDQGKLEVSTTPFYHPILPLLCGGDGTYGFNYPDDAAEHVTKAIELYKSFFGCEPSGFWPAEGSVNERALSIFKEAKLQWIATDEEILLESLKGEDFERGKVIYKPFEHRKYPGLNIFFRDKNLSNNISFDYAGMEQKKAVSDFITHMRNIRDWVQALPGEHVVTVALDGENPWEYFPDGGKEFLNGIYGLLPKEANIELTTFRDIVKNKKVTPLKLNTIHAGSWINHDFHIWIGSREKDKAWELLAKTREALAETGKTKKQAWEEIYAAESSDWFWWYGDDFTSENDSVFDSLFRMHLMNVYKIMGKAVPAYLKEPIVILEKGRPRREPTLTFTPTINGRIDSFYEWEMAGLYNVHEKGSTMFGRESIVKAFYYGSNESNLHVRIDTNVNSRDKEAERIKLILKILAPSHVYVSIPLNKEDDGTITVFDNSGKEIEKKEFSGYSFDEIAEVTIPFTDLGVKENDELEFVILVEADGGIAESWPKNRFISVKIPSKKHIMEEWSA
ncbi:MAG: hypothetical protein V1883_02640 [Candidatus Omnitrophota bacterium]